MILAYLSRTALSHTVKPVLPLFPKLLPPITKEAVENFSLRLENIKTTNKKNNRYINLTKDFLTNPNFLCLAYSQIKNIAKNTTKTVDNQTWFVNAANKIKNNQYKFKPARKINITKPNTHKTRPLTIGSAKDKVIQKAIYMLFHQIYEVSENIFLDSSHGSRPSRSPHTAIRELKNK